MYYVPCADHDTLLEIWYHRLRADGDLEKLWRIDQRNLSAFFHGFRKPCELVFLVGKDQPEIIAAMWFDPSPVVGAWCGLWVHPAHRTSKLVFKFMQQTYAQAFELWPILYGITKQEALLEPHQRLGYTVVTQIPSAWDGHHAWLVCFTKQAFERSPLYGRPQRQRRESGDEHAREPQRTTL